MILSDVSVKRPVFAAVMSILLVAFGVLSFSNLPLREMPSVEVPIVSISTGYRGASAEIVEDKITALIEEQVAGIGTFFAPIEDVVEDRSFYWMTLVAGEERIDLPEIEF